MQTFIQELAEKVHKEHIDRLDQLTIIFPNRRAGLFFRKALSSFIDKPTWMPKISSLEDFIVGHSGYEKIEMLEAVFLLYEVYKKHQIKDNIPNLKPESFDKFFFWGEMILKDFSEIDHYLVNSDQLFTSIKSQKELDEEFYFLSEEDKAVIQSFWATFLPDSTKTQLAFLETWRILKPVYHEFYKNLQIKRKGYGGLIYRSFLEELKEGKYQFDREIIFAGFNALTFTEEQIIKYLIIEEQAKIYWDIDDYYLSDDNQESGYFLRSYRKDTILGASFPDSPPQRIIESKNLFATGVSLEIGQAKAMAAHLEKLVESPGFKAENTVIVLPNEYMLFPVLHSLPGSIPNVNITMGFPLKDTSVYGLLESLIQMQQSKRTSIVHGDSFYYRPVIEILEHPLIQPLCGKELNETIQDFKHRNLIYVYREDLPMDDEIIKYIFSDPNHALKYLLSILQRLHTSWKGKESYFEVEFLSQFYQHIERLDLMIGDKADHLSYDFLLKLFRRVSRGLSIPFTGEPLNGIQIMGILETRNLDFENVFILNMNEDAWPAPLRRGSFIPYNIRKAFELPVFEHQDAIYAYLFYRLLQRSKNVWFYYNTVAEFNINGELSRFVKQLESETHLKVNHQILANPVEASKPIKISIKKDAHIFKKLRRFTTSFEGKYQSRLTPSALDTYLYCRLRFYFKHVEELYEPDELQEEMNPMVFGNILHDSMDILYQQFISTQKRDTIEPHDFFWLQGGVEGAINKAFIKHYGIKNKKKFVLEGRNIIAADIIKKTVDKILEFDQQYAPFKIIGLEASTREGFSVNYPIESAGQKYEIGLKGKIDRIDIKQGKVRVIDYKTGKDNKQFSTVSAFIDREDKDRNKAAFQVFFYCYLFVCGYKESYDQVEPGLFNSRDMFKTDFNWRLQQKEGRMESISVTEFRQYQDEFENVLSQLLQEIWDPNINFDQIEDEKKCKYCPYNEICGRS